MVGYSYTSTLERVYKVVQVHENGTYGKIRISKDVIFDLNINFRQPVAATDPQDQDFERLLSPPVSAVSAPLPTTPTTPILPTPRSPVPLALPRMLDEPVPPSEPPPPDHDPQTPDSQESEFDPYVEKLDSDGNPVYWYNLCHSDPARMIAIINAFHHILVMPTFDKRCPRTFDKAMLDPLWAAAIMIEINKFDKNTCFKIVPFNGQHLVPMMWLFTIKTDGTFKARLVGRGDKMIAGVDYDPDAVYCGNVCACSIKMCLVIAAKYQLTMRGGDLEGAYLVTRANADFPVYVKTPQGYEDKVPKGMVLQAVGNLYGFPPAGQNFSIEFDKVITECGYKNTPYDFKFFIKWIKGSPLMIIAHSDDFRWFGPKHLLGEWDKLCNTFNAHKYKVTDCTDKEFVGINITCDSDFNYYMDQARMIDEIVKEANMTGAKDESLPYPLSDVEPPLCKLDNANASNSSECQKYPYRRIVGQLMYGMVHTMVCIMYALNVLSRYCNNPGPRHIHFLKHLLKYVKYARLDRLKFHAHDGPKDIATMTAILQLRFQCDADLAGNKDNQHSQTSFLGYLADDLICWCSTDQGCVATSSAESEIKAVNHALRSEVIPCRGIMNCMGWLQETTVIEEDNSACIAASKVPHLTRNLRHLDTSESYFKEKVDDNTCVLVKVASHNNHSDLGTKRVPLDVFTTLTSQLVDRSLRRNLGTRRSKSN